MSSSPTFYCYVRLRSRHDSRYLKNKIVQNPTVFVLDIWPWQLLNSLGGVFFLLINYIVRCLPCFFLEQVLNKIKFEFALHKVI